MKQIIWPLIFVCSFAHAQLEGIDISGKPKKAYYLSSALQPAKKRDARYIVIPTVLDKEMIRFDQVDRTLNKTVLRAEVNRTNLDDITGTITRYHPGGWKESFTTYRTGLKHGPFLSFDKEGKVLSEGAYFNDEKSGIWKEWMDSHHVKGEYVKGKKQGYWSTSNKEGKQVQQFYRLGTALGNVNADTSAIAVVYKRLKVDGRTKYRYGIINMRGKEIFPLEYERIIPQGEVIKVTKDERSGYIDYACNIVIPVVYEYITTFRRELMKVRKDGKYGYINRKNEVVIPLIYKRIGWFNQRRDLVYAQKNGKWGYLDRQGKVVIPFKFDDAEDFERAEARVQLGSKWYVINKQGKILRPYEPEIMDAEVEEIVDAPEDMGDYGRSLTTVSGSQFVLKRKPSRGWRGPFGVQDHKGNWVIPQEYDRIGPYRNGMISFRKGGLYGFFNDKGEKVVEAKYDGVRPFGWRGWDE